MRLLQLLEADVQLIDLPVSYLCRSSSVASLMEQAFALSGIVTLALVGLVASNVMYDRGVPNSVSRYIALLLGGFAFLAAVLWLDAWIAAVLSGAIALSSWCSDCATGMGSEGFEEIGRRRPGQKSPTQWQDRSASQSDGACWGTSGCPSFP